MLFYGAFLGTYVFHFHVGAFLRLKTNYVIPTIWPAHFQTRSHRPCDRLNLSRFSPDPHKINARVGRTEVHPASKRALLVDFDTSGVCADKQSDGCHLPSV